MSVRPLWPLRTIGTPVSPPSILSMKAVLPSFPSQPPYLPPALPLMQSLVQRSRPGCHIILPVAGASLSTGDYHSGLARLFPLCQQARRRPQLRSKLTPCTTLRADQLLFAEDGGSRVRCRDSRVARPYSPQLTAVMAEATVATSTMPATMSTAIGTAGLVLTRPSPSPPILATRPTTCCLTKLGDHSDHPTACRHSVAL